MKRFLSSCARLSRFAISISLGLTALATLGHTAAHAGTIYSLSNSLSGASVQSGWTISGSIELQDATAFGSITSSSIKNWNWTASKPGSSSVSASSAAGFVNLFTFPAGNITATATGLYFQDGNVDVNLVLAGNSGAFLGWDNTFQNGIGYVSGFQGSPSSMSAPLFRVIPADLPNDATYGYQFATPAVALPEPSTYAMALAGLACGGYSMFRRRRAR